MLDTTIKQCNECGKEYPAFLNKCTHCGCANEIKSVIGFNTFTKIWLCTCIVVAVIDIFFSVIITPPELVKDLSDLFKEMYEKGEIENLVQFTLIDIQPESPQTIIINLSDLGILFPTFFAPENAKVLYAINTVKCLLLIATYVMLLMRKQIGFYIAIVAQLICIPICILVENSIPMYVAISSIILLNLFLNLKQNRRTYWDAMKIAEQQTAETVEE